MRQWIDSITVTESSSLVQEDYDPDEHFEPRLMRDPKVLYRAVSIPELIDVWANGAVFGGRNKFNAFEPRRHVFFGDKLDDELIGQGEDIERQAYHALSKEPVYIEYTVINREITDCEKYLISIARNALAGNPRAADVLADVENGDVQGAYRARRWYLKGNDAVEFDKTTDEMREFRSQLDDLYQRYRGIHGSHVSRIKAEQEKLPITSAVLVTKPITGGLHYSESFGKSGMTMDEYGFQPGTVTMYNLDKVILIKDGKPVGELPWDDIVLGRYFEKVGLISE